MPLQPGGTYYGFFVSTNNSGVLQAADSLPTAVVKRNGATDSAVTVTITAGTIAGEYVVSFAIPDTYVDGDQVLFRASWLVNGYQKVAYGAMVVLAAPATGSGNAALTVTVTNSVTAGDVSGAEVTLINSAGGVQSTGVTDSDGVTVPALAAPAAVYTLTATATGYLGVSQTVTLDPGANPQSVILVPVSIPAPTNPALCNTVLVINDAFGQPVANATNLTIQCTIPPATGQGGITGNPVAISTNSSGIAVDPDNALNAYLPLYQTAGYSIQLGNGKSQDILVPPQLTWEVPVFLGGS